MKLLQLFFLTLLSITLPLSAQFDPFDDGDAKNSSEASFISELTTIKPGQPFKVAIKLDIPDKWHSYYINPGLIGDPINIKWNLPEGFTTSDIEWQTPHVAQMLGQNTYGYTHTTYYPVVITPPANLPAGTKVELKLSANWQICDDNNCVYEPGPSNTNMRDFTLTLNTGDKTAVNTTHAEDFNTIEKHAPKASDDWNVTASDNGNAIAIKIIPPKGTKLEQDKVYYFDKDGQTDAQAKQTLSEEGGTYILTIPRDKGSDFKADAGPVLTELTGILSINDGDLSIAVGTTFTKISADDLKSASVGKLLGVIGGMILGGLILNLMPCVFPVIGLKIMGFAQQAGEEKSKIVLHGITFAAGVLISFWALSGLLLSLRNAALAGSGKAVGWGYQLQDPYVVLVLLLLMFIMALNMYGVFEIGTSATGVGGSLQNKKGLAGSFFSGVLATVVATPCSAPFLGAAIGTAFALPNFQFMLAFTGMAVGLALPYLVLSIFPQLVEKLPRPGPWMESFKQGMSFLLFATAGYLLWVYVGQTGLAFMLNLVLGLSALSIGLWIFGRWNLPFKSARTRWIAKGLALLFVVGGTMACLPPAKSSIEWEKWSQARVDQLTEEGTPVYIDYTAQWCLTCQVNKKRAYTEEVSDMFKEYGIVALKADKTNPDPEIEKALQKLGRSAIPVNVLYVPGKKEPIITPEVLSAGYLKELISENLKKPEK